jgi:hyperpolarization activated cyclic nucleotide-gated potassium channel 2
MHHTPCTIDILATVPFDAIIPSGNGSGSGNVNKLGRLGKIFRLMRIFKLLRLLKLGRILRRLRHTTILNPNYMLLIRTLAVMGMVLHWTACGYWFIVTNAPPDPYDRPESDDAWMPPVYIRESPSFGDRYGYAFFWSISVVTGAGWDIIPATGVEVFYSSVTIIFGTVLYITILGSVTSIVSNLNIAKSKKVLYTVNTAHDALRTPHTHCALISNHPFRRWRS